MKYLVNETLEGQPENLRRGAFGIAVKAFCFLFAFWFFTS